MQKSKSMEIVSHKLDESLDVQCPLCNAKLNGASAPGGEGPKPGDLSICIQCSGVLEFQEGPVVYRHFPEEEIAQLPEGIQKELQWMRKVAKSARRPQSS